MPRASFPPLALAAALLPAAAFAAPELVRSERHAFALEEVAGGLSHPWGLAFLPDGAMLVTERRGRLRLVADGRVSPPIAGVPAVYAQSQGGLLDVALDPAHADNGLVYLAYAEPGDGGAGTAVARGRLVRREGMARLEGVEVIFRQVPKVSGGQHFGCRLVFDRAGHLYVALGERNKKAPAQDLASDLGKVVRINLDGSVPADNPFVGRSGARPEIWSYGHRNIQGAALDPATGRLWTVEHGARGGDEINVPEPGRNYGWPVITHGVDYSGARIGVGKEAPGMEQPLYYWVPSIAPSGLAFYDGDAFPEWKGDVFVGALKDEMLVRLDREGGRIVGEERMLQGKLGRIRDVRAGPDGSLYLLTDEASGGIWRLSPASPG
jgi:glucose/arabinose dehydrogenase